MSTSKNNVGARRFSEANGQVESLKVDPLGFKLAQPGQRTHRSHRKSTPAPATSGVVDPAKPRSSLSSALGMITHKNRAVASTSHSATDTDTTLVASSPPFAVQNTDNPSAPIQKASTTSLPKRVRAIGRGISQFASQNQKEPERETSNVAKPPSKRSYAFRPSISDAKPPLINGRDSPLSTRSGASTPASKPRTSPGPSSPSAGGLHMLGRHVASPPDAENRSPSIDRSSSSSPQYRSRNPKGTRRQASRPSVAGLSEGRIPQPAAFSPRRLPPSPLSSPPDEAYSQALSNEAEKPVPRPVKKRLDSLPRDNQLYTPARDSDPGQPDSTQQVSPSTLCTTPTQKTVKKQLLSQASTHAARSPGALTNNALVAAARSSALILDYGAEEASALADISMGFEVHVSEGEEPDSSPSNSEDGDDTITVLPQVHAMSCRAESSPRDFTIHPPASDNGYPDPVFHPLATLSEQEDSKPLSRSFGPSSSSVNPHHFKTSRVPSGSQGQSRTRPKHRSPAARGRRWSRASMISQNTSRRLGLPLSNPSEQERGSILSWEAVVEKSRELSQSDVEDMIAKIDIGCIDGAISPGFGSPRQSLAVGSECSLEMVSGRPAEARRSRHSLSETSIATSPESPCPLGAARPLVGGNGVMFTPQKSITEILLLSAPPSAQSSPPRELQRSVAAVIPQLKSRIADLEERLERATSTATESKDLAEQEGHRARQAEHQRDTLRHELGELGNRYSELQAEKEQVTTHFEQELGLMKHRLHERFLEKEVAWQEERATLQHRLQESSFRSDRVQLAAFMDYERAFTEMELSFRWNNVKEEAGSQISATEANRVMLQVMLSSLSVLSQQVWVTPCEAN